MQTMYAVLDGAICHLQLPPPKTSVLPNIRWGSFDELLTPAYWKGQAWQHQRLGTYQDLRLGRSLIEELAACLLGGYGMPAELGLAAYRRLRDRGLLIAVPKVKEVERALSEPFLTPGGQRRHYRFPHQKARYLVASLKELLEIEPPADDLALRNLLMTFPGIGPKTASWIVRNHRGSDAVAIIDVHILRAGRHLGLFPTSWEPQRHYIQLESAFIQFATALGVRAAILDALMWDYMRRLTASGALQDGQASGISSPTARLPTSQQAAR
jgi:thermostable 8-oxoguanine DNA glycosylase